METIAFKFGGGKSMIRIKQFKRNSKYKPVTKYTKRKIFLHLLGGGWAILIIIIIRPLIKVYFAPLATSRVGHLILDTEILLAIIESEKTNPKNCKTVFWIPDAHVSNMYAFKIWQNKLKILKHNKLTKSIYISALVCENLTSVKLTYRFREWDGYLPYIHKLEKRTPIFNFPDEDVQECLNILKKQGIDIKLPWVCILSRDNIYLEKTQPNLQWDFNSYRNSNIETFIPAAEWLATKNVLTFRMGGPVQKPFSSENQLIIDYANCHWKNDKLDIFLSIKCLFFLSTSTGLDAVAIATGNPLLCVNLAQPLTGALKSKSNYVFILKKFYSRKLRRFININEYTELGRAGGFTIDNPRHLIDKDFIQYDIEIIDNSPEEILDVVKEMYEIVTKPALSSILSPNQQKYWDKFPIVEGLDNHTKPVSRIGQKFIDQNLWLIE